MDFGKALEAMKGSPIPGGKEEAKKVARHGWNGKGVYIYINGCELPFPPLSDDREWEPHAFPMSSFIIMKTADNYLIPWLASQSDILAVDWEIVD